MPYSQDHKRNTRARIILAARDLFNEHGFAAVSIDDIMARADLTRGGFYNHFRSKEDLFFEAVVDYAEQRETAAGTRTTVGPELARQIFSFYVSREHVDNPAGQCPLMALPSDIYHAGPAMRAAYTRVLRALVEVFDGNVRTGFELPGRGTGLAATALCVGAAVLARTVDDESMRDEIVAAANGFMSAATGWDQPQATAANQPSG